MTTFRFFYMFDASLVLPMLALAFISQAPAGRPIHAALSMQDQFYDFIIVRWKIKIIKMIWLRANLSTHQVDRDNMAVDHGTICNFLEIFICYVLCIICFGDTCNGRCLSWGFLAHLTVNASIHTFISTCRICCYYSCYSNIAKIPTKKTNGYTQHLNCSFSIPSLCSLFAHIHFGSVPLHFGMFVRCGGVCTAISYPEFRTARSHTHTNTVILSIAQTWRAQTREVIVMHWSVIAFITDILTNIEKRGRTVSMERGVLNMCVFVCYTMQLPSSAQPKHSHVTRNKCFISK